MNRISALTIWVIACCCCTGRLLAEDLAASPAASTEQSYQAVDRAINYLQEESSQWLKTRKCAACHHVPMPLWALSVALQNGYKVDEKYLTDTFESVMGSTDHLIISKVINDPAAPPDTRPEGQALNMGLPFLAVAAQSRLPREASLQQSLRLIDEEIIKKQLADGSWEFFTSLRRPPINENQLTDAAWILLALQGAADKNETKMLALSRAKDWWNAAATSGIQQEKALKILVAAGSAEPRDVTQPLIDELFALQREDGGWSQTIPELKSDAFATGQTLYALSQVGYGRDHSAIKRGIDFLVATQLADGSWPMTSRSKPDGSPGGAKLLSPITCAATSWATLALSKLVPKLP